MTTNHFVELAKINVSEHVEKKNGLSYLSWPWAIDQLMRHDPAANWIFHEPQMFGETMMVSCTVTAFNKPVTMHLPVMDHRNNAIKNPDAFAANKNMMRCLVKAIACHGLGLYIYSGEDLPADDDGNRTAPPKKPAKAFKPDVSNDPFAPAKAEPAKAEPLGDSAPWKITLKEYEQGGWAGAVLEGAKIALELAQTPADVVQIFKVNREMLDRLSSEMPEEHKSLLDMFSATKTKLLGE